MSEIVSFIVPGTAVPFARTGGGKNAPRFTPKRQRNAMAEVKQAAFAAMAGRLPVDGPVELCIEASYLVPTSWSKKRQRETIWKTSKPDLDNLIKLVKDACNKTIWRDDAQVCKSEGVKRYAEREQLRITVRAL